MILCYETAVNINFILNFVLTVEFYAENITLPLKLRMENRNGKPFYFH